MGQALGQQFVVESRAGAGSNIAAEYVARAPKDGYTLFMATIANTINPALSQLPFDFARDLAPVSLVASSPQLLVVHPSLGVSSVQELIALAQSRPEQIPMRTRAPARCRTCRARCSTTWRASRSSRCPIRAAPRG